MLILMELFPNFFEVHYKLLQRILPLGEFKMNIYYKISTPVVFCPSGLLSGVGIFSGLLSGGLLSVHRLSYHVNLMSTKAHELHYFVCILRVRI